MFRMPITSNCSKKRMDVAAVTVPLISSTEVQKITLEQKRKRQK